MLPTAVRAASSIAFNVNRGQKVILIYGDGCGRKLVAGFFASPQRQDATRAVP